MVALRSRIQMSKAELHRVVLVERSFSPHVHVIDGIIKIYFNLDRRSRSGTSSGRGSGGAGREAAMDSARFKLGTGPRMGRRLRRPV